MNACTGSDKSGYFHNWLRSLSVFGIAEEKLRIAHAQQVIPLVVRKLFSSSVWTELKSAVSL